MLRVLILAVWMYAWQVFDDKPLTNYILTALVVALLCVELAIKSRRRWPVYAAGAAWAIATAKCGQLYAGAADGYHALCDKGTSLPTSLVGAVIVLMLCVFALGTCKK